MKNKNIVIGAILILLVIAIGLIIGFGRKEDEPKLTTPTLKFQEIANLKESNVGLPDFKIEILGAYEGSLDRELLEANNAKIYEFDAAIDNGWNIVTNHYVGMKLYDVIDIMIQDGPFDRVRFDSTKYHNRTLEKTQMEENIFLVFSRDGKPIREANRLTLLDIDNRYSYSVEDIDKIYFTRYDKEYNKIPDNAPQNPTN